MLITVLFTFFTTFFNLTHAAEPTDRWLIELKSQDPSCLDEWWTDHKLDQTSFLKKPLPIGHWWVVVVPQSLSSSLHKQPCVLRATRDQKIEWRKQPNDPTYINQVDMNLIGMPKAWDITTGGLTPFGDTIVVALIDDGYQTNHPDLIENIWVNHLEIPGDGLDNDGNGYNDDYVGYNVSTSDDQHQVLSHGTSVAGIVGAKGNNGIGVSGVSWDVKIMLISGANFESAVIEAYQYILDMRNRYTQTQGSEGAYIVATNLSGGINRAFAVDHPLWCEMYDKLGEKGILSVTAAPNESISVDVDGDMPTTCTSPYMIAVTNVDAADQIVGNAGYGLTSIDIGAPGQGTVTTASGSQYKAFPGTSAAAPHVAGAIGLIYSAPCPDFFHDIDTDPSTTALRIRNLILTTGKPNNSLDEITVTGRRLQVDDALLSTVTDCGITNETSLDIVSIRPNPAKLGFVSVYFEITGDATLAYYELFNIAGAKIGEFPVEFTDVEQGFFRLDASPLPAGMYLITMHNQGQRVTRKLVVIN